MDKEEKKKLREAGWSEEEIVDEEMQKENVTISKERYEELIHKEDLLAEIQEMTNEEIQGEYGAFNYKEEGE